MSAATTKPLYALVVVGTHDGGVSVRALPIEIEKGWWFTFNGKWYRITAIECAKPRKDATPATLRYECHVEPKFLERDVLYFRQQPPKRTA